MDLILWRHAEAEELAEGGDDLVRPLTPRGEKHASRMAAWLDRQLPEGTRVLASPALRCEQTAQRLGRKYKVLEGLAPGGTIEALLDAVHWPTARQPVVVVGHQPVLGQMVSHLLHITGGSCAVRKGSVWWLRTRERDGHEQTVVWAVLTPELVA
ncbi:MAG TPA: phosphohistidine phosphatase SixA [Ramlibacter sp.]|nr:phosphohistidine phosphatase SixA [Ramlibacter sp.]